MASPYFNIVSAAHINDMNDLDVLLSNTLENNVLPEWFFERYKINSNSGFR